MEVLVSVLYGREKWEKIAVLFFQVKKVIEDKRFGQIVLIPIILFLMYLQI